MIMNIRQQLLLDKIKDKKFFTSKELRDIVTCSDSTLQRDLKYLEQIGEISRSYGGVEYKENTNNFLAGKDYLMYEQRKISNLKEKIAIAKVARNLINDGDVVYLTHGTTTSQIANYVEDDKVFTAITDGLDIVYGLEKKPNVRVLSTGGLVNYGSRQIENNPYIVSELNNANINKLIMGIAGLSMSNGITFYDFVSFSFLQQIISNINEIIVVADHTKFDKVCLANFIPLDKINKVVTDDKVDNKYLELFEQKGIEYYIAEVE
ncbi:DeoR/GlpR family DNA-binding transcription regulator [Vallitalea guaymasensis]|uniref:DeoR/GlpR family DNA-binding transcription regulator n=1 Tax=Vallitalea guaymasensis TaxID=1185412 RepID=UPI00235213CF|nr:DeoR/GlpR family DNA-binding transcription regulator [Vallitalea guaymasensis]